jgi:hypothetical protein
MRRYSASVAWSSGTLPFDAGVVERDVESAEFVDRELHHRFHVRLFGDIGAYKCCIAAKFFNLGDNLRALLFAAPLKTTFAPARANAIAVALPMPDVPPVTMQLYLQTSRSCSFCFLSCLVKDPSREGLFALANGSVVNPSD